VVSTYLFRLNAALVHTHEAEWVICSIARLDFITSRDAAGEL